MKKLVFGLIATVMFGFVGSAQLVSASSRVSTSIKLTAKFHAVITYLESKDYYKAGMSKDAFIKASTVGVTDVRLVECCTPYLTTIYTFHTKKLTADQVYDNVDGTDFANVINSVFAYEKSSGNTFLTQKMGWLNWLRKLIDTIDDIVNG
jgi:hypothetical protein